MTTPQDLREAALYDAIEEALLHHRLCGLQDDEGSGYPLVDRLCTPGSEDIGSGNHEIRLICDAICCDEKVLAALSTPSPTGDAPAPIKYTRDFGDYATEDVMAWIDAELARCDAPMGSGLPYIPADKDVGDALRWLRANLFGIRATPPGDAGEPVAHTTERHIALREAHEIEKSDSYFKARQHLDSETARHMFRMGFQRGFDAGEKVYATPRR